MNTVLKFSRIELKDRSLLLDEIHEILSEVGAHNVEIYDKEYWDWQYNELPTGISFVYVAWNAEKIVGYFHVPVYRCLIDGQEKLIGNVQDVAVNSEFRGAGVFRSLSEFANHDVDKTEVDCLYTFPNDKSIRTFLAYNHFSSICKLPIYLRPVKTTRILQQRIRFFGIERIFGTLVDYIFNILSTSISLNDSSVDRFTEIDESIEKIFREYGKSFPNHIIRDSDWLEWRYLRSARGRHHILGLREAGQLTAVVVLKEERIMGNPSCVIMDYAFLDGKENSLLGLIQNVCRNRELPGFDFNLMYISGVSPFLSSLSRIGFIKGPEILNPRVLNLLGRSAKQIPEDALLQKDNWLITLGDWDVF